MRVVYVDSSALVKLVRAEPETEALTAYLADTDLVSCELAVTEVPRAIRRAAAADPGLPLDRLLQSAAEALDALALVPVDRPLLATAGSITEPLLRTLDAIHVMAAASISPLDAFVTYDERQGAVARIAGLRTYAPGT